MAVTADISDNHQRLSLATEVELDSTFWLLPSTVTRGVQTTQRHRAGPVINRASPPPENKHFYSWAFWYTLLRNLDLSASKVGLLDVFDAEVGVAL